MKTRKPPRYTKPRHFTEVVEGPRGVLHLRILRGRDGQPFNKIRCEAHATTVHPVPFVNAAYQDGRINPQQPGHYWCRRCFRGVEAVEPQRLVLRPSHPDCLE